jgi:hypothetical protein
MRTGQRRGTDLGLWSLPMPHPFLLRRFIWIVFVSVLIGALYGDLRYGLPGAGAIVAGSMGAALFSLGRFVLRRNAGGLFPRLPFLPYLALRTCLYAAVVIIINGIANSVLSGRFMVISDVDLLVSLVLVVAATLLLGVNDLLGPGTLLAFAGEGAQPAEPGLDRRQWADCGCRLRSGSGWRSA